MGLLNFFLSAATTFGRLLGWLRDQDRQDRERIATYFDQIAACMQEVAERMENGDPPRDTCRRLVVYASELQQILGGRRFSIASSDSSVEATRLRLAEEIDGTIRVWKSLYPREEARERQALANIEEAAKSGFKLALTESDIDILTNEMEHELMDQTDLRLHIESTWEASGEFKALADSLRAR